MFPQAGSRLGPYELVAPIGAGGMGEVWRGRDTRLDRSVAVKILPTGFAEDAERRQRFEREAKTISSLNHPHICTLFDVGHEGDTHFLVMELVEGESLADRLQKGPLPLDQALKFGAHVAEALAAAHKQGIVHRDLKPGNVMLTKSGGAKLLDFGRAFSASSNRVLAYRTGATLTQSQLAWFDRAGRRLETLGEPGDYSNLALSPDGRRVAVCRRDPKTLTRDIWLFELERGTASRFTFDPSDDLNPVFSPDGARVLFTSDRGGTREIYWKAATGVGADEPVFEGERTGSAADWKSAEDWSPDGRFVIFNNYGATGAGSSGAGSSGGGYLWVAPLQGDRKPMPFLVHPFRDRHAQFSPDGRWIAYSSNESGADEIYVQPLPESTGKWKVSTAGGLEPRWRRDGRELFYIAGRRLMAADVRAEGSTFRAGVPRPLFEAEIDSRSVRSRYVVSSDGQWFLMNTAAEPAEPPTLTVVVNWR